MGEILFFCSFGLGWAVSEGETPSVRGLDEGGALQLPGQRVDVAVAQASSAHPPCA